MNLIPKVARGRRTNNSHKMTEKKEAGCDKVTTSLYKNSYGHNYSFHLVQSPSETIKMDHGVLRIHHLIEYSMMNLLIFNRLHIFR